MLLKSMKSINETVSRNVENYIVDTPDRQLFFGLHTTAYLQNNINLSTVRVQFGFLSMKLVAFSLCASALRDSGVPADPVTPVYHWTVTASHASLRYACLAFRCGRRPPHSAWHACPQSARCCPHPRSEAIKNSPRTRPLCVPLSTLACLISASIF